MDPGFYYSKKSRQNFLCSYYSKIFLNFLFCSCCAKRSFQSVVHERLLSVRSSVRPSVRKIIDFCEEDMEDGRVLLSTDTLNS